VGVLPINKKEKGILWCTLFADDITLLGENLEEVTNKFEK